MYGVMESISTFNPDGDSRGVAPSPSGSALRSDSSLISTSYCLQVAFAEAANQIVVPSTRAYMDTAHSHSIVIFSN